MKILIVDDHKSIAAAYKRVILSETLHGKEPVIVKAYDCRQGYDAVMEAASHGEDFNLAIVDQNLPPYNEQSIYNGADLIKAVNGVSKNCKTLLVTAYQPPEVIAFIISNIHPDGIAIKSDLTLEKLVTVIDVILSGGCYYTSTVKSMMNLTHINNPLKE